MNSSMYINIGSSQRNQQSLQHCHPAMNFAIGFGAPKNLSLDGETSLSMGVYKHTDTRF